MAENLNKYYSVEKLINSSWRPVELLVLKKLGFGKTQSATTPAYLEIHLIIVLAIEIKVDG